MVRENMVSRGLQAAVVCGLMSWASAAMAEGTSFQVRADLLKYSSTTSKDKPNGGKEVESKINNTETAPTQSLMFKMSDGPLHFYLWPMQGKAAGVGYSFSDALEVGGVIALNDKKVDKPKDESSLTGVGVFAIYKQNFGKQLLEVQPTVSMLTEKTTQETTTAGTTTKVKTNNAHMAYGVDVFYVLDLNKNLQYAAGLNIASSSIDKKEAPKSKVNDMTFGVTLAQLRVNL